MTWVPPKIWDGDTAFVIGSGPSIYFEAMGFDMGELANPNSKEWQKARELNPFEDGTKIVAEYLGGLIADRCTIGVNNSMWLGEWVDIGWFGDSKWYRWWRKELPKFGGLVCTCCPRFKTTNDSTKYIHFLHRDRNHPEGISRKKGHVSWNKNSGGSAINLAYHLGAKKIVLIGFDMQAASHRGPRDPADRARVTTHYHGCHRLEIKEENQKKAKKRVRDPNAPYRRFLKGFPAIAADAEKLGIELVNTSLISQIKEIPKKSLKEVVNETV